MEESNQDAIRGGVLARMVDDVGKARFFDIRIMDAEGVNEIQPAAPVKVTIELRRPLGDFVDPSEMQAVHFAGEGAKLLNTNIESETAVSFDAKSFSIYGVVTIETESGVFTFEDGEYVSPPQRPDSGSGPAPTPGTIASSLRFLLCLFMKSAETLLHHSFREPISTPCTKYFCRKG